MPDVRSVLNDLFKPQPDGSYASLPGGTPADAILCALAEAGYDVREKSVSAWEIELARALARVADLLQRRGLTGTLNITNERAMVAAAGRE